MYLLTYLLIYSHIILFLHLRCILQYINRRQTCAAGAFCAKTVHVPEANVCARVCTYFSVNFAIELCVYNALHIVLKCDKATQHMQY